MQILVYTASENNQLFSWSSESTYHESVCIYFPFSLDEFLKIQMCKVKDLGIFYYLNVQTEADLAQRNIMNY